LIIEMSAPSRHTKVLTCQYSAAIKADHPNLWFYMNPRDISEWFIMVTNLRPPLAGGEFVFRLGAPPNFPLSPPSFTALTPNGVFDLGGEICISIGTFHAKDAPSADGASGWRPALGMVGFAREVVNGMIVSDGLATGIRILQTSPAEKKKFAEESRAYNVKHIREIWEGLQAYRTENPELAAVRNHAIYEASHMLRRHCKPLGVDEFAGRLRPALGEEGWAIIAGVLPKEGELFAESVEHICRVATEYEFPVRALLLRALCARIVWEHGKDPDLFRAKFQELVGAIPDFCGQSCRELVPSALRQISALPEAFIAIHTELEEFIICDDIDLKSTLGQKLVCRVQTLI
jgi:ubiquitin-protein ligase